MALSSITYDFTLDDVEASARSILASHPNEILARRLLREVLHVAHTEPQLQEIEWAASRSKWVSQLAASQLPNGSWGRFHTQDTKVETVFRTTEEAIDRAFSLGCDPHDVMLTRTHQYIQDVLEGYTQITDRVEKHPSWPLLIKLILSGRLAQIDSSDPCLGVFWIYLENIAEAAFASGKYSQEDEANAHLECSGLPVPQGFIESQHALWILSSRPLPSNVEYLLVDWIWRKPDGIRYLRAPLENFSPRQVGYWLRSMNILARFPAWREISVKTLNNLWMQRDEDGLWDFGTAIAKIADFPLSESWRKAIVRKQDYSTCILVLLRKAFD